MKYEVQKLLLEMTTFFKNRLLCSTLKSQIAQFRPHAHGMVWKSVSKFGQLLTNIVKLLL